MAEPLGDYESALDWLDSHIDLERLLGGVGVAAPTLDRMQALADVLGDPQNSVPAVHITGTNGKGSTARLVSGLLGGCGLIAGSYTSPHIERVNDRIALANEPLSDEDFTAAINEVAVLEPFVVERLGERPNYFEVMAAAAYNWFASSAHVNVIEVGMGGRWDATNVVDAAVAVITNIGADHLEIIGPTLEDVAAEKAAIISPGSVAICAETAPGLVDIVAARATEAQAELWCRGRDWDVTARHLAVGGQLVSVRTPFGDYDDQLLAQYGAHQAANAATAIVAVEAFFGRRLDDDVVATALAEVSLPARFEIAASNPTLVIDGAHNPDGAAALRETLAESLAVGAVPAAMSASGRHGDAVLLLGMNRPHDVVDFCEALHLGAFSAVVTAAASWPRAIPAHEVADAVAAADTGVTSAASADTATSSTAAQSNALEIVVAADVEEGLRVARERASEHGVVVASGSLYLASEVRQLVAARSQ